MKFILRKIAERLKRLVCDHSNYSIMGTMGPTARGKIWFSCKCRDCGQWFVYERHSGKRYFTNGPGFGATVV